MITRSFAGSFARTYSARACVLLELICHVSLQNRLEAERECQQMMSRNLFSAMILHKLIKKICNGSTYVEVDDVIGNAS